MARKTRLAVALAVIAVLLVSQVAFSATAPVTINMDVPSFAQLDPDTVADATAAGVHLTGKELKDIDNNSASYKQPSDTVGRLALKDVRGTRKGIAILVDFPVENTEGKVSDVPGVNFEPVPANTFNDLMNGTTYNPYTLPEFSSLATFSGTPAPTDKTLRNYYSEVSYGQFSIDVDVVGWYTLPHSYNYYLGQDLGYYNENGDAHIGELVSDAIDAADAAGVNFKDYAVPAQPGDFRELYNNSTTSFVDNNGNVVNEIVPNIFIIHRGTGAEYSRDPSIIWSHKWSIASATYYGYYYRGEPLPTDFGYKVVDGVVVNTYNTVPEVGQDLTGFRGAGVRPPSPPYAGTYAHEFGHVLGAPDQYDYAYDSEGTGNYSLMAGGSYGRSLNDRMYSGNSPVDMDAWTKYLLGFVQPIQITPADGKQHVTFRPVSLYPDVYKLDVPGSDGREYFLIENRQQVGFDEGLQLSVSSADPTGKGVHGLAVFHVDEDVFVRHFGRPNQAENWDLNHRGIAHWTNANGETHYGIALLQADGLFDLEHYQGRGNAGDLFPGSKGVTTLSPMPNIGPNTVSYYDWGTNGRSISGITIDNIVENADGTITADVYYAK